MSREEQYKGFYDEIFQGKSYIDNRLNIQTSVTDFLVNVFFGQDFSRVVYTNPEFAFRKRIEALAKGVEDKIFFANLDLPFCNFWFSGQPKIIKTMSASEWNGYMDEDIGHQIHFFSTVQDVSVQFYFNRSDDATLAFELAQQESLAAYPVRYINDIYWRNKTLQVPVWITVKEITAGNDSFNESEWLKKNNMYALTLKLEVETVRVHIHYGKKFVQLPYKWHATGNIDTWKDGDTEYFTQKCILMWAEKAWHMDVCSPKEPTKEVKDIAPQFADLPLELCDEETLKQIQSVMPNNATAEMVQGYFKNPVRILFNRLKFNEPKTTITEEGEVLAWFDVVVKPSTYQYWDYTDVYVPSRQKGEKLVIKNCKDNHVVIDGLHPNSTYTVYFIAHDIDGNFNTIPVEFTTPVWSKETLPVVDPVNPEPEQLTNIEKKESEAPTIIRGRGLIGLEL